MEADFVKRLKQLLAKEGVAPSILEDSKFAGLLSELSQTGEMLQESEERFRVSFEQDQAMKILVDPVEQKIVDANPTAAGFYGFTRKQMQSMTVNQINIAGDDQVRNALDQAAGFKKNHFEFRHRLANGEIRDVEVYTTPVKYHGRKVLYSIIHDVTEQKKSEKALAESRRMTESILKASSVGLTYLKNRRIVWANQAMEDMFGYTAEEYIGQDTGMIYPDKAEYERVGKIVYGGLKKGKPVFVNAKLRRKDGSIFYGHYKVNPVDPEGPLTDVIVSIIDITELIEVQEKLKESRRELEMITANIPNVIWKAEVDEEGNFSNTYISETIDEYLAVPPGTINHSWDKYFSYVIPEYIPRIRKTIRQGVKKPGSTISFEYEVERADKQRLWVLSSGRAYVEDGKVKIFGYTTDITQSKLALDALSKSEQILNKAEVVANQGSFYYNLVSREITWSENMYKLFRLKPEDGPPDRHWYQDIMLETDYHRMREVFRNALVHKTGYELEAPIVFDDGTRRQLLTMAEPDVDEEGELIGFIGITQDVTERKQVETDLRLAKEQAEESDRLKSAFLATMSHELRTPLNAIIGFSESLISDQLSVEEVKSYGKMINFSGDQLLEIIEDILMLTMIEANETEIHTEKFHPTALFESLETVARSEMELMGKNQLVLKPEIPGQENQFFLNTDREKLEHIFRYLLKNALKFTETGQITYGMKWHNEQLTFFVKDTGIGIKPVHQKMIFEKFRQIDDSHTRRFGGTGLGLYITKRLIELLNGKIWVESKYGKGSGFYFYIPDITHKRGELEKTGRKTAKSSHANLNGLSTLIVEDEPYNRELLQVILEKLDVNCFYAETGKEAVELTREHPEISLILMDLKLPDMDGFEATRKIRQFDGETVIIAQTALAMEGDKDKALQAGCNSYIAKPIRKNQLLDEIKKYF